VEEQTFVRWVELPEAQTVRFDDVPGLIAGALHEDEFAQAAAEINLDAELRALVQSNEFMVRNPLTLGRHTFPMGQALRDSVLLPEDLRPLLASRGIGLRLIPYVATAADAAKVPAMPTKASQAAKKEAREDARLAHCEANGLVFDRDPLRPLPYGIARAAASLDPPITRQSLSTDVKAALRRRFELARNGKG
jgi:hypothetical protein